jgi:hypothetical protein
MTNVYYKTWTFSVPDNWNEIDRTRMLQIMEIFYRENDDDRGRLLLFRALAQIPYAVLYLMKEPELITIARDCTEFLFENKLTKNPIMFWGKFAGPADSISNMKIGEFTFAEFAYMQYVQTKDVRFLHTLVATIYRSKRNRLLYSYSQNPDGDYRVPFNPNLVDYNTKVVSKWPRPVLDSIFHFYQGARAEKIAANPKVFDGTESQGQSLYGMWSVMRSVAKAGHFGDFDKVQDQYIDTVLMELNETVVEAEKLEAERNKVTLK